MIKTKKLASLPRMESPKKKQQKRAGFASQQARWATTNGSSGEDLGDKITFLVGKSLSLYRKEPSEKRK